jgi:hypothetical protein
MATGSATAAILMFHQDGTMAEDQPEKQDGGAPVWIFKKATGSVMAAGSGAVMISLNRSYCNAAGYYNRPLTARPG